MSENPESFWGGLGISTSTQGCHARLSVQIMLLYMQHVQLHPPLKLSPTDSLFGGSYAFEGARFWKAGPKRFWRALKTLNPKTQEGTDAQPLPFNTLKCAGNSPFILKGCCNSDHKSFLRRGEAHSVPAVQTHFTRTSGLNCAQKPLLMIEILHDPTHMKLP